MSKDIEYPIISVRDEDVTAALLLSFYYGNDEESKLDDMGENIYFEDIVTTTTKIKSSSAHDLMC